MRRLLLWMAANGWLRNRIPRLWFARRAVRRFMPGEDLESALAAGVGFQVEGLGTLFTRLGENLTRIEEADAVAAHYRGVLDELRERRLDGEISVKLTQLGFDLDVERTLPSRHVAAPRRPPRSGKTFWIDMEGSAYTEATIAFYERMKAVMPNTGICLQAYLRRTAADIQRLLPLRPEIRLVKGAYAEPASIAYQGRHDVDANYLALCVAMLEAVRAGNDVRIALGTHDVRLIEQIAEHAAAAGPAEDVLRGPDAVRHPDGPATTPRPRGLHRSRSHRVRRGVVPVVHAPPRRATGERALRAPPDRRLRHRTPDVPARAEFDANSCRTRQAR